MPKVGNVTPVPIRFEESEDPEPTESFVAIEPPGLLIAALSYASRDWSVFPVRSSVVYGSANTGSIFCGLRRFKSHYVQENCTAFFLFVNSNAV